MAVLDRVTVDEKRLADRTLVTDPWFTDLPVVAQLRRDGLDLHSPVTVIIGENGLGKSTFVEGLAYRWGGSLTAQVKHWLPETAGEDSQLNHTLVLTGE